MQLERRSINVIGFARVTPLLTRHQFENKPALRPGCPRSGRLACSSLVGETQLGRAARCSKTPARHRSPQPAPSTRPQGTKARSALLVTRAGLGQMRASLGCRVGFPPNLPQNDLCFCWEKEREPALRSRAGRVGEVRRGTGRMRAQTPASQLGRAAAQRHLGRPVAPSLTRQTACSSVWPSTQQAPLWKEEVGPHNGGQLGDLLLRMTVKFAPRNPPPRPPRFLPRLEPAPNRKLTSHQTRARSQV